MPVNVADISRTADILGPHIDDFWELGWFADLLRSNYGKSPDEIIRDEMTAVMWLRERLLNKREIQLATQPMEVLHRALWTHLSRHQHYRDECQRGYAAWIRQQAVESQQTN